MARQPLRVTRGSDAQVSTYVGPDGEPVWNQTKRRPHFQDGATPGGVPISTIGDLTNAAAVVSLVVQGTQDGNPTLDQWSAIQTAWNNATALGLPLLLTPGPTINGILDVRISRALKQHVPNARLRTDGRVRLHGYATDFTSTTGSIGSAAGIDRSVMVFIGPDPSLSVSTRLSGGELERLTLVFHPPVDGTGARVPSLVQTNLVYLDRVDRPRVRSLDGSGLNAGAVFAFTSCTNVDFDGILAHDCAMVVDPIASDPANRNAQISGVSCEDLFEGRGINPTVGGSIRNVVVYGLTSNRNFKQIDGIADGGTRGVVWSGLVVRGADEGLDTAAQGSSYLGLDFTGCTCAVKVGHGASNNRIEGKSVGGSSGGSDGRACVLLFAGNRSNTLNNRINWQAIGYTGTRVIEIGGDNPGGVINGVTTLTKVGGSVVDVVIRASATARLMTDGSSLAGNVMRIDLDDASIAATPAVPAADFFQMSNNPLTRVALKRGVITRPVAADLATARTLGATPWSGWYKQDTGVFNPMGSWADLDIVHGNNGTGILVRAGAGSYSFTKAPTLDKAVLKPAGVSGGPVRILEASNDTPAAAGNSVVADYSPNNLAPGLRSGQFKFSDPSGGGQITFEVLLSNGDAPATTLGSDHQGNISTKGQIFATSKGHLRPRSYTVAQAPTPDSVGEAIYFSNGRKVGEAAGAGTGVLACFSNGQWRRLSDDTPVAA